MIWIVLTVAVLVCGLLLCCVYLLSNKICSLKRQVRELNEKIGIANCFPEYSRVYLNDTPVGKGRQIRIRCGLYNKASRLIPFMAPRHECFSLCEQYRGGALETPRRIAEE